MKKIILMTILFCVASRGMISAQTVGEKTSVIHVSLVPPLSTNGSQAAQYTNKMSFNILVGISKNEKAFTLGGIANVITQNANGLQIGGIANIIGNNASGLQFAGLANATGNNATGLQFAGLANATGNNATGLRFAGLANVTGNNVTGMQFAGLANVTGNNAYKLQLAGGINVTGNNAKGLRFAGLANATGNNAKGLQFAGAANATGNNAKGLQFAGLANAVGNNANGLQFAGAINAVGGTFSGFQLAGIGNIVKNVEGIQIGGLFNKAKKVKGMQIASLLNIAESSDYPIGLVNIIKTGEKSIGITYDESGSVVAAFRSGGRVMYGIIGVGYNHRSNDEEYVTEGGIGAHIPVVNQFRINMEIKSQYISSFSDTHVSKSSFSILPAFTIVPHWEIFAGPSINYMETDNVKNKDMFPSNSLWKKHRNNKLEQLFIGYTAGIQFVF